MLAFELKGNVVGIMFPAPNSNVLEILNQEALNPNRVLTYSHSQHGDFCTSNKTKPTTRSRARGWPWSPARVGGSELPIVGPRAWLAIVFCTIENLPCWLGN